MIDPDRSRYKNIQNYCIWVVITAINYMSTNLRGDSYSKIITQRRSKELNNKEISTSFQQLYDLLSRKSKNLERIKLEYKSVPKPHTSVEIKSKININIAYENHVQKRISPHQINKVSKGLNCDLLPNKLETFCKQRGSLTPNQKKTSTQTTNEKLKNLILGKRNRKSQFFQDKLNRPHIEQYTTPIGKYEKLQPINMKDLAKKRNLTANSQQSIRKLQKSPNSQQRGTPQQFIKKIKTEQAIEVSQTQPDAKLKKGNINKRLMINGAHLMSLLKHSSKTSDLKDTQPTKGVKAKKDVLQHLNIDKTQVQEQQLDTISRDNSPGQKRRNQDQKQFIFGKALDKLPISQHIIWKIQKMLTFNLFFLRSFGCEIFYSDPRYLFKYHKSNKFYRYYVGGGNNRSLIVQTLRKRWWWKEVASIQSADFVWTQQKNSKVLGLLNQQRSLEQVKKGRSNSIVNFSRFKESSKKTIQKSNDKFLKRLLTHSYKTRKVVKSGSLEIKEIETPQILHNHISNSSILGDKKNLFFLLNRYIVSYKQQGKDELFSFVPETFHIKNTACPKYLQYQQTYKANQNCLWIVKPGQNSNRGRGIFLSSQIQQIRESIQSRFVEGGTTIVQKYKTDLLLYKGRKFDIRTYMLCIIIRGVRKYFWYSQGYVRTSSHPFNLKELNPMVHLTNDAIQNKGEMYGKFQKGNKLSYNQLQAYLNQTLPQKDWKLQILISKMKEIAKRVASASYPLIDSSKREGFELFGLDFIVDSNFNPWLLQVNTNPCLQVSAPVLESIIPNVIQNLFRLGVDPLFPPSMLPDKQHEYNFPQKAIQTNKFQLVFDSQSENDEGWQLFCENNFRPQLQ